MLNLDELLIYLAKCEPHRPYNNKDALKRRGTRVRKNLIIVGLVLIVTGIVLAVYGKSREVNRLPYASGVCLTYLGMVAWIATFAVDPIFAAIRLRRWKKDSLRNVRGELAKDELYIRHLMNQPDEALRYAQYFLKLRLNRIEGRVAQFFGDKAAAISLFALIFSLTKDVGGIGWITTTFQKGMSAGNLINVAFLFALVLIAGLALGAATLRVSFRRYTYQLELVEMAQELKAIAIVDRDEC